MKKDEDLCEMFESLDLSNNNNEDNKINTRNVDCKALKRANNGNIAVLVANFIKKNDENCVNKNDVQIVTEFYSLSNLDLSTYDLQSNVNTAYVDLELSNVYSSGLFLHDIDGYGYTIAERLTDIRRCIYLKLAVKYQWSANKIISEYFAEYDVNVSSIALKAPEIFHLAANKIDPRTFELVEIFDVCQNSTNNKSNKKVLPMANAHAVARKAIDILCYSYLFDNNYVSDIQVKALQLQFEFCNSRKKGNKNKWKVLDGFQAFRGRNGYPRVKDLTVQWLYLKLCSLLCLHPTVIQPLKTMLFNGPLYHYFCQKLNDFDGKARVMYFRSIIGKENLSSGSYKKKMRHRNNN